MPGVSAATFPAPQSRIAKPFALVGRRGFDVQETYNGFNGMPERLYSGYSVSIKTPDTLDVDTCPKAKMYEIVSGDCYG